MASALLTGPRRRLLAAALWTAVVEPLLGWYARLAAAALQLRVRDLAAQAEASLTRSEALPAEAAGAIGVQVAVTGAWPVLVRLLRDIKQASPSMVVDDPGGAVAVAGDGAARPLAVTLTVLAFRAAEPRGTAGAAAGATLP